MKKFNVDKAVAILLGIEEYADKASLPVLRAVDDNIYNLKNILHKELKMDEGRIKKNWDKTPNEILREIDLFIKEHEPEVIFFYYSGHGLLSEDYKNYYLALEKTDRSSDREMRRTSINVEELCQDLSATKAELIIILD